MDLWTFAIAEWHGDTLTGWEVAALDGRVGAVVDATYHFGESYLVVEAEDADKVLLPAGIVSRIDRAACRIVVNRSRDEICGAPAYHDSPFSNIVYRAEVAAYYGRGGAGYRPPAEGDPPDGPFRYTLVTPSGRVVARHVAEAALQPDDVVDLGGTERCWRVFTVLGGMATVVHEPTPRIADAP